MKWKLLLVAIGSVAIFACDGSAVVLPENNTRVDMATPTDPIGITVLLRDELHQELLNAQDFRDSLRIKVWYNPSRLWLNFPVSPPYYIGARDLTDAGTNITETSHIWGVTVPGGTIERYRYVEPGTYGKTVKFYVEAKAENGQWLAVNGLTVPFLTCEEMLVSGEDYCPYTEEVHLRSEVSYVPDVTLGKFDCEYGDPDCSRCVPHIMEQTGRIFHEDYHGTRSSVYFEFGSANAKSHNQGVARFADRIYDGKRYTRVATSYNNSSGFSISAREVATEAEVWHASSEVARPDIRLDINHPGGMQAHGDFVVVAMEQTGPTEPPAEARFYQVTGDPMNPTVELANTLVLDGSQGEPFQAGQSRAASAGFVKLYSGYFLLAVAGASDGKQGIWFYESTSTVIDQHTDWVFVDFWEPHCTGWGNVESGENCFANAAGTVALLTGCDGFVYMYSLGGTRRVPGKDHSETQLYRMHQDSSGGIDPTFLFERRKSHGIASNKDETFRWAAGTHVMSDGLLTVTAMIRKQRGTGPKATRIKTWAADSTCQIHHPSPGICGAAIYLEGQNPAISSNQGEYSEDIHAYDHSLMDWTQDEEDIHDAEVEAPGGAT